MKKRILTIFTAICCLFTCAGLFSSCGDKNDDGKIKIVTTIFPEYDWVNNIIGDENENISVTLLLDNGVDVHSYNPSFKDISDISRCDLFIYVGGETDDWVEKVLKDAVNKDMKVINLFDVLGKDIKEEELVEGMEDEEEEGEEETEYDEHVWLSPTNTRKFVKKIAETICELDAANSQTYKANADAYDKKLIDLDEQFKTDLQSLPHDTVIVGDRFPFLYLFADYNLKYYAACKGCSSAVSVSLGTTMFLAEKIDELGLKHIFKIENSDGNIAKSIISYTAEKNQEILTLNSLQSMTDEEYKNGKNYLSVMKNNLEALKKALA